MKEQRRPLADWTLKSKAAMSKRYQGRHKRQCQARLINAAFLLDKFLVALRANARAGRGCRAGCAVRLTRSLFLGLVPPRSKFILSNGALRFSLCLERFPNHGAFGVSARPCAKDPLTAFAVDANKPCTGGRDKRRFGHSGHCSSRKVTAVPRSMTPSNLCTT